MSASPVVTDTSPIIALDRIGKLDLLHELYGAILVPLAVARETAPRTQLPVWIVETALEQPLAPRVLTASLGQGESAAIALAVEREAKRRGLLAEIKPDIDGLRIHGFRVSNALRERILLKAGETPD